ncbi:MAG: dephospho-CoA kinase [Candidatus Saganbacteria bacterium]|nr:dephospho-CoA kinase [Candidatus Saganbacteria bacterium]
MKSKIQNPKSKKQEPRRSVSGVKIIGLTGPIASGKDTVCKFIRKRKAYIIDADKIGHEVLAPQSPEWHKVLKLFGSKVLMRGGRVNRRKLGGIVFSNPNLLKKLDSIMHPAMVKRIKEELRKQSTEHTVPAGRQGAQVFVINAAVLKGMGLIPLVDEVWVVLAPKERRIKWLMRQKGFTREQAAARIRAQVSDKDYIKIADKVIRNTGTIKELKEKVFKNQ